MINSASENYGFYGVASVTPNIEIANPDKNLQYIIDELKNPSLEQSRFIVFPELSLTGYSCADLFFQSSLIEKASNALLHLCEFLADDKRIVVVGAPILFKDRIYNCAVILADGKIQGIVPKVNIPNYQEFYEKRWFASGCDIKGESITIGPRDIPFGADLVFNFRGIKFGVEICEDLWVPSPPSTDLCSKGGAVLILNPSATDITVGKYEYLKMLVQSQSGRCRCVYAYASAGAGESSTDLVFSGRNIIACDGLLVAAEEQNYDGPSYVMASVDFEKLKSDRMKYSSFYQKTTLEAGLREIMINGKGEPFNVAPSVNPSPFIPTSDKHICCSQIVDIQTQGLIQRIKASHTKGLVVGVSGGLDSTLALLVATRAFDIMKRDKKKIYAVTMPAKATSSRTLSNARKFMERLGVTFMEIPIVDAVAQHFKDINHDPEIHNAVYENSQARERTQILMDLANKYDGIVVGTGDMSEMALGWCTYNGDHMSMYNVNCGVPKTLVKYLVEWFSETTSDTELSFVLKDIISTPISPELIPACDNSTIAQKTEDLIGPYELHDFFLFHVIRNGFSPLKIFYLASLAFKNMYSTDILKKWLLNFYRRFFSQQFKRSCMPDGPKIGSVCLSPRGDWRMPSDASASLWIDELNQIENHD